MVGLLVSLALAEGLARFFEPASESGGYATVRTDGRERRPINSQGYRDLERAIPRPDGVRRAVCLGDSFTWGVGVLFDDAWPQRLERGLARERGETWEAVVLAEPGLNAVQMASRLASEGFEYEPDVVVLAWVLNDSEHEDAAEARRGRRTGWRRQSESPSAIESFLDGSGLVRLVRTRLHATAEHRERVRNFRSMYADDDPGWIAAQKALHAIGGLCRSRGVPLVVAIFPLFGNPLDELYPFHEEHGRVVQARLGGRGPRGRPPASIPGPALGAPGGGRAPRRAPERDAHRIAAQALVRAVDDVVPRTATAARP